MSEQQPEILTGAIELVDLAEAAQWIVTELKDQWVSYREGGRIELTFYQISSDDPGPFRNLFQVWISDQVYEGETLPAAVQKAREALR